MALNSISSGGVPRMITRGLAAIAMLSCTAAASAEQVALAWLQDPASKCRFVAPRSLTAGPAFWTGACPGGKASGLGMLRRRDAGVAGAAFYGDMRDGVPVIGAINVDGGYVVGKFTEGDLVQGNDEPQVRIDAFNVAAKAARAVSARFQAQKNSRSARYYAQVAQQLDQQIE
jgi:hypothetical protein